MKTNLGTLAGVAATLVVTGAVQADMIGNGDGFAIPDGDPTGLGSSFYSSNSMVIDDITVHVDDLFHTWSGDLRMTLTHDAGAGDVLSATFVNRPGSDTVDGGPSPFGTSVEYGGDYAFNDDGIDLLSTLENSGTVLAEGTYSHTALIAGTDPLSVFDGRSATGTWTLTVADNAELDTGSLGGWSLEVTPVPTPGALALIGLAGLASRRRRA